MIPGRKTALLALVAFFLAYCVVVLGAYVRLSDAGLGCPDWPGCYGQMVLPVDAGISESLEHEFTDRPLVHGKAWKEMTHRYAAGTLGLLILFLFVTTWAGNRPRRIPLVPLLLVVLVLFQALLGMWTVTLLLKPVIVVAHLLGGMMILSLLFWFFLRAFKPDRNPGTSPKLFTYAVIGIVVVFCQIALGGWTSANYAALACPDFPSCQGQWWPPMNFVEAFTLWRGLGVDYEFGVLDGDARTAIHMTHRMGAVITALVVGIIACRAWLEDNRLARRIGIVLFGVLLIQLTLGVCNVLMRLPLPVAVAHNGVAAFLLLTLVALLHQSCKPRTVSDY